MTVGYVAGAALQGITLTKLEIRTKGTLDLRGFLGLDDTIPPGYEVVDYAVSIAEMALPSNSKEIHQTVMKTSPNYFNLTGQSASTERSNSLHRRLAMHNSVMEQVRQTLARLLDAVAHTHIAATRLW